MLAVCAPVPVTRLSGSASGTCFAGCALHYRQRAGELGFDDHQPFVGDAGIDDFLAAFFPIPLSPLVADRIDELLSRKARPSVCRRSTLGLRPS